jgi:hypothetical protein
MLPALKHRPQVTLLLAHRRDDAARVAAIGVCPVEDGLLVHLKRMRRATGGIREMKGPSAPWQNPIVVRNNFVL